MIITIASFILSFVIDNMSIVFHVELLKKESQNHLYIRLTPLRH